jgi:hypothetical protein
MTVEARLQQFCSYCLTDPVCVPDYQYSAVQSLSSGGGNASRIGGAISFRAG